MRGIGCAPSGMAPRVRDRGVGGWGVKRKFDQLASVDVEV